MGTGLSCWKLYLLQKLLKDKMGFRTSLWLGLNTLFGFVALGCIGYVFSNVESRYMVEGSWQFGGFSAPIVLFISACIALTHDLLLSVTGFDATKTRFFVTFHGVMALFYLGSGIATIILATSDKVAWPEKQKHTVIAGAVFGILAAVTQGLTSVLSRASM